MLYHIFDIFFVVFHTVLIIFNITGWIWKKTRFINLVTLLFTGGSWLILGLIIGTLGYCPLTEWHFEILYKLGKTELPDSYVKYLADRMTGLDINAHIVDSMTLCIFIVALLISSIMNYRDMKAKRES